METLAFMVANWSVILARTLEHVSLVRASIAIAICTAVPTGIAITPNPRAANAVLYAASIMITVPSIALFGLLILVLSLIGQGIGYLPALIALVLYAQLPTPEHLRGDHQCRSRPARCRARHGLRCKAARAQRLTIGAPLSRSARPRTA